MPRKPYDTAAGRINKFDNGNEYILSEENKALRARIAAMEAKIRALRDIIFRHGTTETIKALLDPTTYCCVCGCRTEPPGECSNPFCATRNE